jgi:hypothetical protein
MDLRQCKSSCSTSTASARCARVRAGANPRKVGGDLGISSRNIDRIESVYSGIPDNLLAGIERLLSESEKRRFEPDASQRISAIGAAPPPRRAGRRVRAESRLLQ